MGKSYNFTRGAAFGDSLAQSNKKRGRMPAPHYDFLLRLLFFFLLFFRLSFYGSFIGLCCLGFFHCLLGFLGLLRADFGTFRALFFLQLLAAQRLDESLVGAVTF